MNRRYIGIGILLFVLSAMPAFAQGGVHIRSQNSVDMRFPIVVPAFAVMEPELITTGRDMALVMAEDLVFSGLFIALPESQYPQGFQGMPMDVQQLQLDDWRTTKAEYLVYGLLRVEGEQLVGQFRLFDLHSKEQVVGQELRVPKNLPRLAAHRFSEEIIRYLDGVSGIGTTELCFSQGGMGKKEIYVADYDGFNLRQVTKHDSISIKPKMSPDGTKIAYLSYKDRYSYLYVFDRKSGVSTPLSKEVGLNSAPAWAPDGNRLAMTLSKDGNMEIYLRDVNGGNPKRLTDNRFIDTSPCFSPDGKRIAFVSDRGGRSQIFMMNADGTNQKRLSFQGGSAYDPAWSPDGKYVAYVAEKSGEGLEIYVMNADGTNPQRITNSHGTNESPSWSPDSRHVTFMSNRNGKTQIFTITLETKMEKVVRQLAANACEGPSWGPRRR